MAAQRFGGRFSPNPQDPQKPAADAQPQAGSGEAGDLRSRVTASGKGFFNLPFFAKPKPKPAGLWRSRLLFWLSFAYIFPAFRGTPEQMLLSLSAGGGLILSAWLTRQGQFARFEYENRKLARRPAIPRILFGAIIAGLSLGLGGVIGHGIALEPLLYTVLGIVLHLGAFGLDPMRDKGMEGVDRFQTDRVARAIGEAERSLAQMKDAILRARDRGLENRVEAFAGQARALFRRVENDPGDLTAARKYLSVYLEGARDATVKFADLWAENRDPQIRREYESLLSDLETTFAQRSELLLGNDRSNLDIEIEVLRDRLQFETPAPRTKTPDQLPPQA